MLGFWSRPSSHSLKYLDSRTSVLFQLGGGHPNTTTEKIPTFHIQPPEGIACTSIVAQDGSGNVFHGRNLDWNLPDDLRNLTVQVYINFVIGKDVVMAKII